MKNPELKQAWKDFINWSKPGILNLDLSQKKLENIFLKAKIQNRIIEPQGQIVRVIVIRSINNKKIFQDFDFHFKFEKEFDDLDHKKNMESILCENEEEKIQGMEGQRPETVRVFSSNKATTFSSSKEDKPDDIRKAIHTERGGELEKKNFQNENQMNKKIDNLRVNNYASRMRNRYFDEFHKGVEEGFEEGESLAMNGSSRKKDDLSLKKFEKSISHPHFKLSKLIHHNKKLSLQQEFFPTAASKENISNLMDSNISYTGQQTTTNLAEKSKFKISKIEAITETRYHRVTIFTLIMISLILLINYFAITLKYQVQQKNQIEIPVALIAVDIVCWITWVQLYGIISLEGNRAVREGWIGEYDMKRFIKNKSYWEGTYPLQSGSDVWIFAHIAEKSLDKMVRKFQFLNLFKGFHKWVDDDIMLDFYEVVSDNKDISGKEKVDPGLNKGLISINNKTKWFKQKTSRLDAMMLSDIAGAIYMKRNYENASLEEIPSLGEERDRNNDPFEDYFRKLLIGEPLKAVAYRTWDMEEYLKDICIYGETVLLQSSVIGGLSSLVIVLVMFGYLSKVGQNMRKYYEIVFNIKVEFF